MAVPIRLTPPTSANVMASETSDTPAPDPVTTTNLEEDMANLAVSPTQLVPSTHVTRIAEFDADDQALSLAISPATGTSSDVVETTEEPLGFFGLPRELRDEIYKLLDQTVEQSMWYRNDDYVYPKLLNRPPRGCDVVCDCGENDEGCYHGDENCYHGEPEYHEECEHDEHFERYDLEITVSLPQLRLVNKQFKQEYDESYELANNRLEISTSPYISGRDWHGLELPSIARRSTELEMDFAVTDDFFDHPGCVWCSITVGYSMSCNLSDLSSLLVQLPNVTCIRIGLLSVPRHTGPSRKTRFLGCPYEHDRCPGFEYWRDGFAPSLTQLEHINRDLLPKLARDLTGLRPQLSGGEPRLPPQLEVFIFIGRDSDKPTKNEECIATWTNEDGLEVDLDAADRCGDLEIYRT